MNNQDSLSYLVEVYGVTEAQAAEALTAALTDSADACHDVVLAIAYGNLKHGTRAWVHHQDADWRFIEKILRHLFRFLMAPTAHDVDSGQHHLNHVLANAVLLHKAADIRGRISYKYTPRRVNTMTVCVCGHPAAQHEAQDPGCCMMPECTCAGFQAPTPGPFEDQTDAAGQAV